MDALRALADAGHIGGDEAETLINAYRLYRSFEHRLQMVDDQQTHSFPKDAAALDNVAQLAGLESSSGMFDLLAPSITSVGTLYDGLDGTPTQSVPQQEEGLEAMLTTAGFPDAASAAQRVTHWRSGTVRAPRALQACEAPGLCRIANG